MPVRFIDLPYGHQLALRRARTAAAEAALERVAALTEGETPDPETDRRARGSLAGDAHGSDRRAGDGRRRTGRRALVGRIVEARRTPGDVFAAITEAMSAVRARAPGRGSRRRPRGRPRCAERFERRRQPATSGSRSCAGAWHVPALIDRPTKAHDDAILRALPKAIRVQAAWVPWTYERLAAASGYGAGIASPGWYEHLWKGRDPITITWMARVARTFRDADLDISPAHLIEATRLAETLSSLRGRAIPSLDEMTEAVRTVVTMGSDVELAIVRDRLIVGRAMGAVPADAPIAPLASDLAREQRRLRLRPRGGREVRSTSTCGRAIDLDRSHLLHRLALLDVPWGTPQRARGKAGTFHELWSLAWKPEFVVSLIAMSR